MDRARRAGLDRAHRRPALHVHGPGAARPSRRPWHWPPSTLVVSEFQTGGASASDEFVEIANQGYRTAVDIVGSRARVRDGVRIHRHAQGRMGRVDRSCPRDAECFWPTRLAPSRPFGDLVYSGGLRRPVARWRFGSLAGRLSTRSVGAMRRAGSSKGPVACAAGRVESRAQDQAEPRGTRPTRTTTPRTGSSRRSPSPQGFASPPVPTCGAAPTPTPTPPRRPTPTPTPGHPRQRRSRHPRRLRPQPRHAKRRLPTPTPAPHPPTPTPATTPTPPPPDAAPRDRQRAEPCRTHDRVRRRRPDDRLGRLELGRGGFIQDGSGGIAIYLDAARGRILAGRDVGRCSWRSRAGSLQLPLRVAESRSTRGTSSRLPARPGDNRSTAEGTKGSRSRGPARSPARRDPDDGTRDHDRRWIGPGPGRHRRRRPRGQAIAIGHDRDRLWATWASATAPAPGLRAIGSMPTLDGELVTAPTQRRLRHPRPRRHPTRARRRGQPYADAGSRPLARSRHPGR